MSVNYVTNIQPGDTVKWVVDDDMTHTVDDASCGADIYDINCYPKQFFSDDLTTVIFASLTFVSANFQF
jgi:plastocyanin